MDEVYQRGNFDIPFCLIFIAQGGKLTGLHGERLTNKPATRGSTSVRDLPDDKQN